MGEPFSFLINLIIWVLIIGAALYILNRGLALWEVEDKVKQFIWLVVLLLLLIFAVYYVLPLRLLR